MVDRYTYRVSWSEEDQEYVGTCAEFPGLSHLDAGGGAALHGIEALACDVVAVSDENWTAFMDILEAPARPDPDIVALARSKAPWDR